MDNNGASSRRSIFLVPQKAATPKISDFTLKWALKRIARKLHGLAVPYNNYNGAITEEWEAEIGEAEQQDEQQSRYLLRKTDLPNRLLDPILTLSYLLMFWYVSVDLVFSIGSTNQTIIILWLTMLLMDMVLNLNTVKLSDGKALKTRRLIFFEYLRKELSIDIVMILYIILQGLNLNQEIGITAHLLSLVALVMRLSRKG